MADRGIALKAASGNTKSGRIVPAAGVSPEHAQIEMFEPKHVDGKTQLGAPQGTINFQFNPKEVTISKSAKWERKPVKG